MDVRDDLTLTRELSSMLNDRDKHVTFKDLADECGIKSEIYRRSSTATPWEPYSRGDEGHTGA